MSSPTLFSSPFHFFDPEIRELGGPLVSGLIWAGSHLCNQALSNRIKYSDIPQSQAGLRFTQITDYDISTLHRVSGAVGRPWFDS